MTISRLVEQYLRHCERTGVSKGSLRHYRSRLRCFVEEFGDRKPGKVKREDIIEHVHTSGAGLSGNTVRANIGTIQRLQKFAKRFGFIKRPWFKRKDIPKPAGGQRERIATEDETRRIMALAPPEFAILYRALRLTGARPSELCNAMISNIHLISGDRTIVLQEHKTARKIGRARRIQLGSKVAKLVDLSTEGRTEGPIFLDQHGKAWTRDRASRVFREIRNRLEISRDLVLYSARHEFATAVTRKYGIAHAQILLGHRSIKTTERYTHFENAELRIAQETAIEDIAA